MKRLLLSMLALSLAIIPFPGFRYVRGGNPGAREKAATRQFCMTRTI
jgi:hypothetical protein